LIDLSHTIEHGQVTYPGLPSPIVCDFMSREASRALYAPGTEFHIGKVEMIANTGTYLDAPFHRFASGLDVSQLGLEMIAGIPGVVIDGNQMLDVDVRGKAVLFRTGWSQHFGTAAYGVGHPFLTEVIALHLRDCGAKLVGIDSLNIDDTKDLRRPVHTALLGAGIPIVEHLTNLEALPHGDFRFFAVPPKIKGMGTFPVRAFAMI
jgi:kynurenine formamidase